MWRKITILNEMGGDEVGLALLFPSSIKSFSSFFISQKKEAKKCSLKLF
jgi:hypothetical protein